MIAITWLCAAAAMLEIVGDRQVIQMQKAFGGEVALQVRCQHGELAHPGQAENPSSNVGPYAEVLLDNRLTPDQEGIAAYLTAVRDCRLRQADAVDPAALVKQLGAPTYHEREQATQRLAGLTPLPLDALREAANSGDPEIGERATSILATSRTRSGEDPTAFPFLLEAICRTIQLKSIEGLAPLLLDCLPAVEDPPIVRAICDAIAATATANDLACLTRALQAESDAMRHAAVYGLRRIHTAEATDALRRTLHDKQEHVRLLAARALLNRAEREALPALAEALESDHATIRHDAVDTLRAVTKQSFGYDAGLAASKQRKATDAWQTWIDDHRRRTPLEFPTDLDRYRYERFKKSISALSSVRSGTVKTRLQRNGEDIVAGTSGFDPGRGIVVVAYRHGQQILRETFPTHVRREAHCERFVRTIEGLPVGATVALIANGEAAQGFSPAAMRGLYAIGGQTKIHGFHAHGTYICIGYRGMLPGHATELIDPSGGPLIYRGKPEGILFRKEKDKDL